MKGKVWFYCEQCGKKVEYDFETEGDTFRLKKLCDKCKEKEKVAFTKMIWK